MAVGGHHKGILVVRFDNDPRHNLTERAITAAIGNLESSGMAVADSIHVLNHWADCRFSADDHPGGPDVPGSTEFGALVTCVLGLPTRVQPELRNPLLHRKTHSS